MSSLMLYTGGAKLEIAEEVMLPIVSNAACTKFFYGGFQWTTRFCAGHNQSTQGLCQASDLTRLPSQTTSSRWQVDKEAIGLSRVQQFSHLCAARPYQISVNSSFKHIHTTSINTIIWQFVPFIYEKWYFLMSHLHCSLTNAALCPLVLLPSLSLKNIFLSTSS